MINDPSSDQINYLPNAKITNHFSDQISGLLDDQTNVDRLRDLVNLNDHLHDLVNLNDHLHDLVNLNDHLHDLVNLNDHLHDLLNLNDHLHDLLNLNDHLFDYHFRYHCDDCRFNHANYDRCYYYHHVCFIHRVCCLRHAFCLRYVYYPRYDVFTHHVFQALISLRWLPLPLLKLMLFLLRFTLDSLFMQVVLVFLLLMV